MPTASSSRSPEIDHAYHDASARPATEATTYTTETITDKNGRRSMEQTNNATVFGRVLGDLMESRGISPEPEEVRALAERSGLEPQRLITRMTREERAPLRGHLDGLVRELELTEPEQTRLAQAFAFEWEPPAA